MVDNTIYDVSKLAFFDKFLVPLNAKEVLTQLPCTVARHESVFLSSCRCLRQLSAASARALSLYCWFCESRIHRVYLNSNYWVMLSSGQT